jgi:integrase
MSLVKNGRIWHYDFWYRKKRYKGSTGQVSKTLARRIEADKQEEVRLGKLQCKPLRFFIKDNPEKERDLSTEYMRLHVSQKKSRCFFEERIALLNKHFADQWLLDITAKDVEEFRVKRLAEGVKPSTVNRDLAVLKGMFSKAIEWGYLFDNPAKRIKPYREDNRRENFLSEEQAKSLIETCSEWLRPLVTVALHTGMRRGELLGLRWRDVDFKNTCLHLDASATKGGRARKVPMNATAKGALEALRKASAVKGLDARVFEGPEGGTIANNIARDFGKAVQKAGLGDFTFHDLRHSCASFLVKAGESLNTVREILGHRSIAMTLRYAHLSPSHQAEAVAALDRLFAAESPQKSPQTTSGASSGTS